MRENKYQAGLIKRLEQRFPGSIVLKLDSAAAPGIPDILVLWRRMWATLEVKAYANAVHQPNQDWFVHRMNDMSFSAFIYPENEEAVLNDLQQEFEASWATRLS